VSGAHCRRPEDGRVKIPGGDLRRGADPGWMASMRIAVLSDTHDRLPPGFADRLREADEVWHLGDVCAPELLADLEVDPVGWTGGTGD